MVKKSFDAVDKIDIEALVTNQVPESRTLEYKAMLPGGSDGERKEFLADISAFANAAGGDILYGIAEKRDANNRTTGLPESANGLSNTNSDIEIRRLDIMILNGIDPRIAGVRIRAIDGFSAGPIIMVRVPKSWASPYMVTVNESRFYSRNNAGKYPLDVSEIRSAFALSESFAERTRRFRDARISRIIAGETPLSMVPDAPKRILHVIPASFADPVAKFDISAASKQYLNIQPIDRQRWLQRFNLDGLLVYGGAQQSTSTTDYLQIFRSGAIESVTTQILRPRTDERMIASHGYEQELMNDLRRLMQLAKELEADLPIVVMVTFTGVKDYFLLPNMNNVYEHDPSFYKFDRDTLLLPDVLVESYDSEVAQVLRPVFDAVWQSAGWDGCKNYDKNSNWAANAGLKE